MVITEETSEISNVAWRAVLKKDRHYDGKFVYAAVTTGIYCRPSCPSRNPHRRNTPGFAEAIQLYIHPVECIDCGACVPVCPVTAIFALEDLPEKWAGFTQKNAEYYENK